MRLEWPGRIALDQALRSPARVPDMIRAFFDLLLPTGRTEHTHGPCALERWTHLRRPESELDKILSDRAKQWLRHMPDFVWPKMLCARHPRIANRLALLWSHPAQCEEFLDGLLADQRGGRSGFSPSVRAELVRLERFYQTAKPSIQRWQEEADADDRSWHTSQSATATEDHS